MATHDEKNPESSPDYQRANEIAVEALKQLLTLASLVLALTVTFIKDALGENRDSAHLQWLIPLSWSLLIFSIWMAWVAMADAARRIGTEPATRYAFSRTAKTGKLARAAQWSFALGLSLLGFFGVLNFNLFFRSAPQHVYATAIEEATAPKPPLSGPRTKPPASRDLHPRGRH